MTETLGPHTLEREGSELSEGQIGSFGRSVPGVEHRVVDPLTGSDVEIGEFGELWVRGYSLMQQLYKREREDTFTPDGWYRTGDGGFFDFGCNEERIKLLRNGNCFNLPKSKKYFVFFNVICIGW